MGRFLKILKNTSGCSKKLRCINEDPKCHVLMKGSATLLIRNFNPKKTLGVFFNVWGTLRLWKHFWKFSKISLGVKKVKVCKWGPQMPCIYNWICHNFNSEIQFNFCFEILQKCLGRLKVVKRFMKNLKNISGCQKS